MALIKIFTMNISLILFTDGLERDAIKDSFIEVFSIKTLIAFKIISWIFSFWKQLRVEYHVFWMSLWVQVLDFSILQVVINHARYFKPVNFLSLSLRVHDLKYKNHQSTLGPFFIEKILLKHSFPKICLWRNYY
jgi:hypothetical protein